MNFCVSESCRWRLKLHVDFFRYLFLIRKSFVINDWNNVERINYLEIREKIVLAFVFREISSIVYNFSFCCELRRCRKSPTSIFLLRFSTNRHIWRIVRFCCKVQKFSNFANSDFSVFLHDSADLVTFGTILRISEIWTFVKREFFSYFSTNWYIWQFLGLFCKFRKFANLANFFCISQRIGTLSDVRGHFANFRNLQRFPSFFFREVSYDFVVLDVQNCCKLGFFGISLRIGIFRNVWYHFLISKTAIFLVFLLEIFFSKCEKNADF